MVSSAHDSSPLSKRSITLIMFELVSLKRTSIPVTFEVPVLKDIFAWFVALGIPVLSREFESKKKSLGTKATLLNGDVAEYSPSLYLYRYANEINLSSI